MGTIALLLYFLEGGWSLLTLKQKDLYASSHSSWRSCGATILQLSNFLFSNTESVGWYEVLASVHQSYTSSSEASKILNGNSRFESCPCEYSSSESLYFGFESFSCMVNTVQSGKSFLLKKKNPPIQHYLASSVCGVQCTTGLVL